MRVTTSILCSLSLAIASCGPPALPPGPGNAPAESPRSAGAFDGEVLGVDGRDVDSQLAQSVSLKLRTGSGDLVEVVLAPGWVLDERGFRFAPNEKVRVKGKHREKDGRPVIEAESVERDGKELLLRDPSGKPLWEERDAPLEKP